MSTLPPLRQAVDRCGGIVAAALLLVLLATAPLRAAEDDPYSVTVSVDATGETSGKARDQARNDGERQAFATLAERLSGGAAPAKLPKLDDNALADLLASFEVANERMSGVRYIADVTYHFRAAEVQRLLQKSGIALGGAGPTPESGKSLVVIPVYQSGAASVLWDDPNPWRDAWAQQPSGTSPGAPHLAVPLGDAGDLTGLEDWVRVRERLAALPAIRTVNLVTLSLQEATIELDYLGSIDQLKTSLAEAKLDLVRGDPQGSPQSASMWRLARSGAPAR